MKKVLVLMISVLILASSIFIYMHTRVDEEIDYNWVMSGVIKNNLEDIRPYIGPVFENRIREGDVDILSYLRQMHEVYDFELTNETQTKNLQKFTFSVDSETGIHQMTLIFTKQPKSFLLDNIEFELGYLENSDLNEQFQYASSYYGIMNAFMKQDFNALYAYCCDDFAHDVGYDIENEVELKDYYDMEMWFQNSKFSTYKFSELYENQNTHQVIVKSIINENTEDQFTLVLVFDVDEKDKLQGFYFDEMNKIQTSGYLFRPATVTDEQIMNPGTSIYSDGFLEKYDTLLKDMDYVGCNSYLELHHNNYKMLYYTMNQSFRELMTLEDYKRYLTLMLKRTGIKTENSSFTTDWRYEADCYMPFFRHTYSVLDDTFEALYTPLPKDSNKVAVNYLNFVTEYDQSPSKGSDQYLKIKNIYFSRVYSYLSNYEYNNITNKDLEIKTFYFDDFLAGKDADFWLERKNKVRALITALKEEDYDFIWQQEKRYSGLESKDELVELIGLQRQVVGSFNGVYFPQNQILDYQFGRYFEEVPFETFDGNYNVLYATFDYENNLIDFNVGRLPK
ncbi:MAG: hypothetical protein JXR88_01085 [Clostridia bacterium]|nr:hypothetical protein [Clostridia bacterium]